MTGSMLSRAALQELGDRQRGDRLVAVEEPGPVGDFPPAAGRSVAVATTLPSISRRMMPSPILIGMRNPLPPPGSHTGASGGPETRQTRRL